MPEAALPAGLDVFFRPSSVAVIGASPVKGKVGNVIFDRLRRTFRGKVYPINPKHESVGGVRCYPSVKEVPDRVDLAVVAVPAPAVVGAVKDCAAKGVRGIIVVSAGFSEAGAEGARLEEEVVAVARSAGARLMGPNCMGVYDPFTGIDTWFITEDRVLRPPKGAIAVVSQSGALATAIMDWAARKGVGVAKVVSLGNMADVDVSEVVEYLADDPSVRVIVLYLEGLKPGRGRRFVEAARRAVGKKPMLVLKAGRTEVGGRAALSHTGSLAGSYRVYSSAFRRAGVIEAHSLVDLFDMARALATQPLAKGRRVAVISNSGGMCVMLADSLVSLGLEVPRAPNELRERLRPLLPPLAVLDNPIDLTGGAEDEHYLRVLEAVASSDAFDMIAGAFLPHPPSLTGSFPRKLAEALRRLKGKPVVGVVFGGSELSAEVARRLEEAGVPVYETPERAARALWAIARYSEVRRGARAPT